MKKNNVEVNTIMVAIDRCGDEDIAMKCAVVGIDPTHGRVRMIPVEDCPRCHSRHAGFMVKPDELKRPLEGP